MATSATPLCSPNRRAAGWSANAGALTFQLRVDGRAAHGSVRHDGVSAIEAFVPLLIALQVLERARNASVDPLFDRPVPYAISVGRVQAGDWASSVPDLLIAEGRMGVALDEDPTDARLALEAAMAQACARDPWLHDHPARSSGPAGSTRAAGCQLATRCSARCSRSWPRHRSGAAAGCRALRLRPAVVRRGRRHPDAALRSRRCRLRPRAPRVGARSTRWCAVRPLARAARGPPARRALAGLDSNVRTSLSSTGSCEAQGLSERQAAQELKIPRTTLQAWRVWHDTLDICPHVADFFHSSPGLAFLHRIVIAFHLVCVEIGACGIRLVCLFLHLTGLDRFVAASYGAQQQVNLQVAQASVAYDHTEPPRLAKAMPPKDLTVTQDETFTGGLCLITMDPESNFIILEQLAQARDQTTWHDHTAPALAQLNCRVIQSTSDEAPGL